MYGGGGSWGSGRCVGKWLDGFTGQMSGSRDGTLFCVQENVLDQDSSLALDWPFCHFGVYLII